MTLPILGLGLVGLFMFKDKLGQTFGGIGTGVEGIGTGVSDASTGLGKGISDLTSSVVRESDKLITRSNEVIKYVTSPTQVIQDVSDYASDRVTNANERENEREEERLKSQDDVGAIQGQIDLAQVKGDKLRTDIIEGAKTTATTVVTQLPNALFRGIEVVKNTLTGSNDNNFNQNQNKITTTLVSSPVTNQDKLKTTTDKLKSSISGAVSNVGSFFKNLF